MKKENTCKTCKHWKNEQRDLNYYDEIGFCINPKFKFETTNGRMVGIFDTENKTNVIGNPAHDFESKSTNVNKSQYLLQTSVLFGCNYHKS